MPSFKILYILLFLWPVLLSCSERRVKETDKQPLLFNDFETAAGWGAPHPSVTKERAHSGKYSVKVDKDIEYSFGYGNTLAELFGIKRPRRLRFSGWVYVPGPETGKAVLVFFINRPARNNESVIWEGIPLEKITPYRQWTKVEKELKLPENIEPTDMVQVYLWRSGATEPVYADDLQLEVLE